MGFRTEVLQLGCVYLIIPNTTYLSMLEKAEGVVYVPLFLWCQG